MSKINNLLPCNHFSISLQVLFLLICALSFGCGEEGLPENPSGNAPVCLPTNYEGDGCSMAAYQYPCDYFTSEFHYLNPDPDWSCMTTRYQ